MDKWISAIKKVKKLINILYKKSDVGLLPANAPPAMSTLRKSNAWATEALNVWAAIETFFLFFPQNMLLLECVCKRKPQIFLNCIQLFTILPLNFPVKITLFMPNY